MVTGSTRISPSKFRWAQPGLAQQVAETKARNRLALATLSPPEAQALVGSGITQGFASIRLPAQELPMPGLSGLLDQGEE